MYAYFLFEKKALIRLLNLMVYKSNRKIKNNNSLIINCSRPNGQVKKSIINPKLAVSPFPGHNI